MIFIAYGTTSSVIGVSGVHHGRAIVRSTGWRIISVGDARCAIPAVDAAQRSEEAEPVEQLAWGHDPHLRVARRHVEWIVREARAILIDQRFAVVIVRSRRHLHR